MSLPAVFVIHVSRGFDERKAHMDSMLTALGLHAEYILEGDMDTLDEATLDRWFAGPMHAPSPATSCAMKHLLAYRRIIDDALPGALILEDDIFLEKGFLPLLLACLDEQRRLGPADMLLSLEDTCLKYVAASRRRKGHHIYPALRDRYAGCYYITAGCARQILCYAAAHRCDRPIDRFHTMLIDRISLPYCWSHPTAAIQGSKNGHFGSSISLRDFRRRLRMRLLHPILRAYKRLIYRLR